MGAIRYGDGIELDCCETVPKLRGILLDKGHHLVASDFIEFEPFMPYDCVIMNPPFENGQDIDHVRRAYECTAPGGRVVAVMSSGTFFRAGQKARDFRMWLDDLCWTIEDLPAGAFSGPGAFRQTGVNTKLVVIHKPFCD